MDTEGKFPRLPVLMPSLLNQYTSRRSVLIYIEDLQTDRYFQSLYRVADKSLARPTSQCILFDC